MWVILASVKKEASIYSWLCFPILTSEFLISLIRIQDVLNSPVLTVPNELKIDLSIAKLDVSDMQEALGELGKEIVSIHEFCNLMQQA